MMLLVLHEIICCSISALSAAIGAFSLLIPLASVQNCLACYHLLKTADIMDLLWLSVQVPVCAKQC